MTNENAILDKLKEKGIVTEEQLKEIAMEGVDNTMNSCAELMHTLLCRKDHVYDAGSISSAIECCWYAEQVLDTCWQQSDHKHWLARCVDEMARQELGSPEELHDFLLVAVKAIAEIHFLKSRWPKSVELLKELL